MKKQFILILFISISHLNHSQNDRVKGQIIKNFGETFDVDNVDIKTDTSAVFKVIFDVSKSSENVNIINKNIVTAARFLNMHKNEGMKPNQLKVALTIHGAAWKDVLKNDIYIEKYGVDNPNYKLIKELNNAGVDIIICGQTAAFRKMQKKDIIPEVKLALSAMTALLQYQNNGYKFIKF